MNTTSPLILAIESAINGGSVSLLRDDVEIAGYIGRSGVSRAEDLLASIDDLLKHVGVPLKDLNLIAVSAGPGSFTGIRIGIATALGLKNGLRIPMASHSALRAMAWKNLEEGGVTLALPVGRNAVCMQTFPADADEVTAPADPHTVSVDEFTRLADSSDGQFLVHQTLFEMVTSRTNLRNFGENLAFAIGKLASREPDVIAEPLFISKAF